MTKFVIIAVLLPVLFIAVVAFLMMYVVKSTNKKRQIPKSVDKSLLVSEVGICSRCGQERVLIKREASICAVCYSTLNTKKID